MSAPDPEVALLQQVRAGDVHALGEIHDLYYPKIYRYALVRLGDEAAAQDIAAEVFVRLLDTLHSKRGPHTTLTGWLFGVAAHLVVDHIRRTARESARLGEGMMGSDSTAHEAEQRLQFDEIRAAMRRLTPDQQNVLTLRFGNGFSLEQTAKIMGKSVNAVKVLQFRATASLRRVLGETGNG
jgi:RNA polymerase sigma-70 factor (ECF subfamily)